MPFRFTIESGGQKQNKILIDVILSTTFFGMKNVYIKEEKNKIIFTHNGNCPNECLEYLSRKYNASFDYIPSNLNSNSLN